MELLPYTNWKLRMWEIYNYSVKNLRRRMDESLIRQHDYGWWKANQEDIYSSVAEGTRRIRNVSWHKKLWKILQENSSEMSQRIEDGLKIYEMAQIGSVRHKTPRNHEENGMWLQEMARKGRRLDSLFVEYPRRCCLSQTRAPRARRQARTHTPSQTMRAFVLVKTFSFCWERVKIKHRLMSRCCLDLSWRLKKPII